MPRISIGAALAVPFVVIVLDVVIASWRGQAPASAPTAVLIGRVVDLDGKPISGANVRFLQGSTVSRPDGWFRAETLRQPQWLEVQRPGFLRRVKAVLPGQPALVRLSQDDGETVVIHAVGDVMLGRRFYGLQTAEQTIEPQLRPMDSAASHRALLAAMEPLLASADLTVGNLETPLIAKPLLDPGPTRPSPFHPSKDFVFASAPAAALALRQSGFDVLGLANNHLFDAQDAGLLSTLSWLKKAGFRPGEGLFGAGLSLQEAWRPAIRTVKGQRLAFLGCTTIEGGQHPISYVASARPHKGGAAGCEPQLLAASIRLARLRNALVVVMLHGGNEYQRKPTPRLEKMIAVARSAGATLILNHHPHVVGGFQSDGHSLVAGSLGNFLFDQTIWPTFESYLVVLYVRHGALVRAMVEPVVLSNYRPYALVGSLADFVARGAAGREPGSMVVENGTAELDLAQRRRRHFWSRPFKGDGPQGSILRAAPGISVSKTHGPGQVQGGRDLLWVGDFEDQAVGLKTKAGVLWNLAEPDRVVDPRAAASGQFGVRLTRTGANRLPVVLSPLHRIPVEPGRQLSLLGWLRGRPGVRARLMLGWYAASRGGSQARLERSVHLAGDGRWTAVRWDVTVPPHALAVGVNVILDPPPFGRSHLDVDGLRLIGWEKPSPSHGPLPDWYRLVGESTFSLVAESLPGGELFLRPATAKPLFSWADRSPLPPVPGPKP